MQFLKLCKTKNTVNMCKFAPKGAHAHICLSQMCLHAPEGDHITFAFGKCVYLHKKGSSVTKLKKICIKYFLYIFLF